MVFRGNTVQVAIDDDIGVFEPPAVHGQMIHGIDHSGEVLFLAILIQKHRGKTLGVITEHDFNIHFASAVILVADNFGIHLGLGSRCEA